MDDSRAAHIKATAAEHAWTHGGRDLTRFIFELLDERTELRERIQKLLADPRRCDDCPGGEDYKTEVKRLRELLRMTELADLAEEKE